MDAKPTTPTHRYSISSTHFKESFYPVKPMELVYVFSCLRDMQENFLQLSANLIASLLVLIYVLCLYRSSSPCLRVININESFKIIDKCVQTWIVNYCVLSSNQPDINSLHAEIFMEMKRFCLGQSWTLNVHTSTFPAEHRKRQKNNIFPNRCNSTRIT